MDSLLVGTVTDTGEGIGVLRGWKEIAQYLRTSERTATRWSVDKKLPVHRSGRGSLVLAYRSELDGWQREVAGTTESSRDTGERSGPVLDAARPSFGRKRVATTGLLVLGLLLAVLGLTQSDRLLRLREAQVSTSNDRQAIEDRRFLVRLEPAGLAPATVFLADGGTATVDFPGRPTLRLKARKNGNGVAVTVAQQITPNAPDDRAAETTLELEEGARVRLKRPFPLVLTWQRNDAGDRGPAER